VTIQPSIVPWSPGRSWLTTRRGASSGKIPCDR
jgi:hypothetical protein